MLMVSTIASTLEFVFPFATHLREEGWRVEAAANGSTTAIALDGIFDVRHEIPLSRSMADIRGIARSWRAMHDVVRSGDYDIVHVHTPIAAFITRAVVRHMPARQRPSVAYTAHGFHFHKGGGFLTNQLFQTLERVAGRWTDRLIVINDEDNAAALRLRIVPASRLTLMPGIGVDTTWYSRDGVSTADVTAARGGLGIGPDVPLFTVVGELSIRKRPFDVVAALGEMRHRDAHVILVGDGPERERVEAAATAANAAERTHFLGWIADPRPYVLAANALVLASSREGLPRAILEALALSVPVITTDARGNPDLVTPDAGIVVPVGDVAALAAAMDGILDDPQAARELGDKGRHRVASHYDLRTVMDLHDHMYEELLARRDARVRG